MIIREIEVADAEKFSHLLQHVEASSEFMLFGPGERAMDTARSKAMLRDLQERPNSTILVAENEGEELVGYVLAIGGEAKRNEHSAYIVAGISADYRGQGIGTKIFSTLDQWAIRTRLRRLELTVVTKNVAGVSLYKKMGYEIDGIKRDSLCIDNEFVDEYYMSKLLESAHGSSEREGAY